MNVQIKLKRQDLLSYLSNAPESGMGYQVVDIYTKDNDKLSGFVFNGEMLQTDKVILERDIDKFVVNPRG